MDTCTLSRIGYVVGVDKDVKKELTVRPEVNKEFGFPPPPFKVFKVTKDKKRMCVPRFYGEKKFGVIENDTRPAPVKMRIPFKGTLRDSTHQNTALAKAIAAGSGVLSLPCGYGKTTVALAIACTLGFRTMIVVHKEFLANQWRERIQQFCPGATIGIVQQDKVELEHDFVIVMLQSLSMKSYDVGQFDSVGTLIVDEAHHICARVFSQALFKLCPKHAFGLSATPDRKDGLTRVLHWFLGDTFFAVERKNQEQVEVFAIKYDCPRYREPPPCNRVGKLSLVHMISDIVDNGHRNGVLLDTIRKITNGTDRQLLVLSDRRLHCQELHSHFPDNSGLYMGGMKEKDLETSSKKTIIFGTFSQAHEGLDIPTLDSIILATPKSDITQSIGRIMRETAGKKNNPRIYDMWDQWSILNSMYMKRRKVYRHGGYKIDDRVEDEKPNPFKEKFMFKII